MKLSAEYERQMTAMVRKYIRERETDPAAIRRRAIDAKAKADEKAIVKKAAVLARQRPMTRSKRAEWETN